MRTKPSSLVLIFLLFNIVGIAQIEKATPVEKQKSAKNVETDYSKKIVQDSAINLVSQVGNEASKLPVLQDKISTKIEVIKILLPIKKDEALGFLDSAWQDVSSVSKEESKSKNVIVARNKVIALASEIAPEKAAKWREFLKLNEEKTDENDKPNEKEKPPLTAREKANALVKSAIAKAAVSPQAAVSEALSTLDSTRTISGYFFDLFQKLSANKQYELLENLKGSLADYASIHPSDDIGDLGVVSSLLTSNLISDFENRRKFIYFLLSSTKLISNSQTIAGNSTEENFKVFQALQIFIRPTILRFSPENLSTFDDLLKDISSKIARDKLENPLLSSDSIETQIEKAEKVAGFEERDRRLTKIVLWLLSKKIRNSKNDIVKLAQSATDKITDLDTKGKLNDFIRIIEIDRLIADKDFPAAEKKSAKISQTEWRAWTLMMLGNLQKDNQITANNFYEDSSTVLRKAGNSAYKAQLMFDIAAMQVDGNQQSAFDTLSEAVKILNKTTKSDSKKKRLGFTYDVNEFIFDSNDINQLETEDIYFRSSISKFARSNWNQTFLISQNIEPLLQRLKFQLLISNVILNKFSKSE